MQNSTYLQLASVTLSDKFHATELFDQHLLHAAIGIQTEVGELFAAVQKGKEKFYLFDRVNFLEEIGDAAWYLSIPQRLYDLDLEKNGVHNVTQLRYIDKPGTTAYFDGLLYKLNQNSCEFLDIMKKRTYYGREIKIEDLTFLLQDIYDGLRSLVTEVGGNWESVLKNNIDKLAARYNGKFSEVLANNRDLASEYTILSRTK